MTRAADPTQLPFQVRLWGVRGSLPVSGPMYQTFGGNTMCIEVRCGDHVLIFDAGSGIFPAGMALQDESVTDIALLFTHCHYDHIAGLPFFVPLYAKTTHVTVWSGHLAGSMTTHDMIKTYMHKPFFPIGTEYCCARLTTREFDPGDVLNPYPDVHIRTAMLNHPGNAVGYRVEWGGRVFALITDTEHQPGVLAPEVLDLIRDADLFLYDATFTDDEFAKHQGFGHSTWQQGVKLAQAAGARRVGMIHHATLRSDAALAAIEGEAQAAFPGAFCGKDLQIIDL